MDMKQTLPPAWYDQPPEPGIYYQESWDINGKPLPGLAFWEPGEEWIPNTIPMKFFGPIPNALELMSKLADNPKTVMGA